MCFVNIHVVHSYSSVETGIAWKKSHFILLDRSDFPIINNPSIVFYTFTRYMLTSLEVDEMLPLREMNWSLNFRGLSLRVKMASCLKDMNSILFVFLLKQMPPFTAYSKLCRPQ